MSRVAGADEAYWLAERLFGWTAPIQYIWIFDRDPGLAHVTRLRDQLAAGALSRKVLPARVPFARDRWVRSDVVPELWFSDAPVPDDAVGDWADGRLRGAQLEPGSGRGWKLECATTVGGKFVLSLLVSHMIADGQALYKALAAAHGDTSSSTLPSESDVRGLSRWRGDAADAGKQLVAAARSVRILAGPLWSQRKSVGSSTPAVRKKSTPAAGGGDTTLAIVDLDRGEWAARAKQFGGTSNGLFIALLGGLLQRAGYPVIDDEMRICIAVSKREDGDERANASGGVWIRVSGDITPARGLGDIRALSKLAFSKYANGGNDAVADNLQAVVRLLPDKLVGKMMNSIVGPDTTVSNLGSAPESAVELGGLTAESFAIRAIMQGRPAPARRTQGPAIAAWAVEYGNKVTITFFGIHPDYFGDSQVLRGQIAEEFDTWSLSHKMW